MQACKSGMDQIVEKVLQHMLENNLYLTENFLV